MTFLDEVESFFGTRCLYEVLNVNKNATETEIKKAYRKTSLKVHPDRVGETEKEKATQKFQVLAQVHYVLSDQERRKLYDDHGIIANDESLENEANWDEYWRLLFPKISEKDIQTFLDSYVGSEEEEQDLIQIYQRYKGDMDKISESHIGFDEERTFDQLSRLIDGGKIPKYRNFSKDTGAKRDRRKKRAEKEAKEADKMREEMEKKTGMTLNSMDDLTAMIKRKSQGNFDSLITNLEAKYANGGGKGTKRKRNDR